jgi:hypothetical protein
MSDGDSSTSWVTNAAVLVTLALGLGALTDYTAVWMGFAPPAGCALYRATQNYAAGGAIIFVFIGVVFLCFKTDKGPGLKFVLGGLFLGILPQLFNGYLAKITGLGCTG